MQKPTKYLSYDEALNQLRKYCDYQERCHQEVRYKLLNLGIRGDDLENIMTHLIEEKYLDEERFARSFARGKFRNKCWGKHKIWLELTKRNISDYLKQKALDEIVYADYENALTSLLNKKKAILADQYTQAEINLRLFKFAHQKGYEPDLIYKLLER